MWPAVPVEPDRALVVQRPARVVAAQPGRRRLVVGAVPGLVAERPRDDRRVVLVALGHPGDALDPLAEIARVVAERAPERVRLDVGLGDDVQPELVGRRQQRRVVRVVRGPDGVEPESAQEGQVLADRVGADDPARVLVEVVAVHAADEDPGAVDQQVAADDLDAAGTRPGASPSRRPRRLASGARPRATRGAGPRPTTAGRPAAAGRWRPRRPAAARAARAAGSTTAASSAVSGWCDTWRARRRPSVSVGRWSCGVGVTTASALLRGAETRQPHGDPPTRLGRPAGEPDDGSERERAGREVGLETSVRADLGEVRRCRSRTGRPAG